MKTLAECTTVFAMAVAIRAKAGMEEDDQTISTLHYLRRLATAEALLTELRMTHHVSEDCWYSCPKALDEDGESACCDDRQGNECNCGADAYNAEIDAFLAAPAASEERTCETCGQQHSAYGMCMPRTRGEKCSVENNFPCHRPRR